MPSPRRKLARVLRRMADRIDTHSRITIDLQNKLTYTDASKPIQQHDIDRMFRYHNAFFGDHS